MRADAGGCPPGRRLGAGELNTQAARIAELERVLRAWQRAERAEADNAAYQEKLKSIIGAMCPYPTHNAQ